ncbi:MAG: CRISPR-associated protein Csx19 [Promethearchaeia archaeon]
MTTKNEKKFRNNLSSIYTSAEQGVIDVSTNEDIGDLIREKTNFFNVADEHINAKNVFLVLYKVNEVLIRTPISIEELESIVQEEMNPKFLKEFRLFSNQAEFHLWKIGQKYAWRYRIDSLDKENDTSYEKKKEEFKKEKIYEEEHIMWGTNFKNNEKIIVEKARKMSLESPFNINSKDELPIKYLVRNYYTNNENNGLIEFFDSRLVKFKKRGEQ